MNKGIKDRDLAKAFGYIYFDTNSLYYINHIQSHDFAVVMNAVKGINVSQYEFEQCLNSITDHFDSIEFKKRFGG